MARGQEHCIAIDLQINMLVGKYFLNFTKNQTLTCFPRQVSRVPSDVRQRYQLSSFYQKYTHAYGIPVLRYKVTRLCKGSQIFRHFVKLSSKFPPNIG